VKISHNYGVSIFVLLLGLVFNTPLFTFFVQFGRHLNNGSAASSPFKIGGVAYQRREIQNYELLPTQVRFSNEQSTLAEYSIIIPCQFKNVFQSLASLEEKINPGELESDQDRLLLIQEKEQLLRELRSINPRSRSHQEMDKVRTRVGSVAGLNPSYIL
jgi:hypothetical protein